MAIILDGSTGISSIGTLTGVTSISSAAANTPVVMQDSGSNTNTCRAWVNFNGTGTVAIRASFNVLSITDHAAGNYTVNFTSALPDANYACVGTTVYLGVVCEDNNTVVRTASAIRIYTPQTNTGTPTDYSVVSIAVFR
jgi:hypothetical protein